MWCLGKMFRVVVIFLINGALCCEIVDRGSYKTVLYQENGRLNLTISDGQFPDDVELTSITGLCPEPMKLLPDEHFNNDQYRKYDHVKQIKVPMPASMSDCIYYVALKSRSLCIVKKIAVFKMKPQHSNERGQCDVSFKIKWLEEIHEKYEHTARKQIFSCGAEYVMCEESVSTEINSVLTYVQIINPRQSRTIQINLRNEDIANKESTFVCQDKLFTVKARLLTNSKNALNTIVHHKVNEVYKATCNGSNVHWMMQTNDHQKLLRNNTFVKKLTAEDDMARLICMEINCDDFESNRTCYKTVLKKVTLYVDNAVRHDLIITVGVGSSVVLALLGAVVCVWCRRRRATHTYADVSRRPRMATPPPERPPRKQLYYSVPFERPIPGPRRD